MRTPCREGTYLSSSHNRPSPSVSKTTRTSHSPNSALPRRPPPLNFGFPATIRMGPHSDIISTSRRSPTVGVVPKKREISTRGTRATTRASSTPTRILGQIMVRLGRGRHHLRVAAGPVLSTGRVHTGVYQYGYTSQVPSTGIPFPSIFWLLLPSFNPLGLATSQLQDPPFVVSFQLSVRQGGDHGFPPAILFRGLR